MRFTVQDVLLQKGCRIAAIVVVLWMSRPYTVVVSPAHFAGRFHGYSFLSGTPRAPLPGQVGPELIAATCSSSSAAAHCLINGPAFSSLPAARQR